MPFGQMFFQSISFITIISGMHCSFCEEKARKIWLFEIIPLLLHRISQKAAHG